MAISDFEIKRIEKYAKEFIEANRPPAYMRAQLELGFRISDQSLELFEIRPNLRNPDEKMEFLFAKTRYVKKTKQWQVFWMKRDGRWHGYEPVAEVASLEEFLAVVQEDEYGCFFS